MTGPVGVRGDLASLDAGLGASRRLRPTDMDRIGDIRWRQRVRVTGRIRALRVEPWEGGVATLECTLVDETGGLLVIFMGRRRLGGVKLGAFMEITGMVLETRGKLAVMNPAYSLLATADADPPSSRAPRRRWWSRHRKGDRAGPRPVTPRPLRRPRGRPATPDRGAS